MDAPAYLPKRLCVVLHDVAPARWQACTRVLAALAEVSHDTGVPLPLTLLVVPRWHGDPQTPEVYLEWLREQVQRGHQLVLHGLTHLDDQAVDGWQQVVLRRVYTAGEGEFAALPHSDAAQRLREGLAWAQAHGLPMDGFVAPAWLLSEPAWKALDHSSFDHTCTFGHIVRLPSRQALRTPSLMFSSRSGPRRTLSLVRNAMVDGLSRRASVVRLDLHPDDADHGRVLRSWTRWLVRALRDRVPVRLAEAAHAIEGPTLQPAPTRSVYAQDRPQEPTPRT